MEFFLRPAKAVLRIMKITAVLLLAICMQVSARVYSQQVTLKENNASLESVLKSIRKQTGYTLLYSDEVLKNAPKVSVSLDHATVTQALDAVLQGQPLTYTIDQKSILIKRKPASQSVPVQAAALIDVSGRITDEQNQPLAGATIKTKDNKHAATSDANGFFTLKNIEFGTTLIVSFIGYDNQEINAAANAGQIKLSTATSKLDEVKVIAYGQTTQRLSTGDISSVSARDIAQTPTADPILALQGRVPGFFVTQTNGFSGSGVNVQVLGQNSIANGNQPLYVIDGVPNFSQVLAPFLDAQGIQSPYALINPTDIESISILKDADATSIYGSRAANGAILITTKKGKNGDTKIDLNFQNGFGKVPHRVDLLNTAQYLQLRNEALKNDGIAAPGPTDYDLNGTYDQNRYTDWQKVFLGGTAHYTDFQGSISGGGANTQFLLGVGDHRETTVVPGDFPDQKTSIHLNLSNSSLNQRLHLQINASYLIDRSHLPVSDPTYFMLLPPNAPALHAADGSFNWALDANGNSTWDSFGSAPFQYMLNYNDSKVNNLTSNGTVSFELAPGLTLKSNFGYTYLQKDQNSQSPTSSVEPAFRTPLRNQSTFVNANMSSWLVEPQVTYDRTILGGKLQALAGMTINQQRNDGSFIVGTGYASDLLLGTVGPAGSLRSDQYAIRQAIYKYNAGFARLSYNLSDKYLFNAALRRDGSSRFGPADRFHEFWSAGAAWVFSSESFIEDWVTSLSFGKLSASYGTTGNDQIGDYMYQSNYNNPFGYNYPYLNTPGLSATGLPNPYLEWEQTNKLRVGLDLGFFKDRILMTANYLVTRSSNQLLPYTLPITTGFYQILENFPATVQNKVWEFTLSTVNIKNERFSWSTSFNLTIPRNQLIAFPGLATSSYADQLVIGQPVITQRIYNYAGVDPQTGLYQFRTAAGTLTSYPDFTTDRTKTINTDPKFYGGLNNTFNFGNLRLDFLFQFTKRPTYSSFDTQLGNLPGTIYNQPTVVQQRWTNPGDVAHIQRANSDYSAVGPLFTARFSSAAGFADVSYVRLKNCALSWQLPKSWSNRIKASSLRIYTQGQNLLTFTPYKGLDPETAGLVTLPPLRMITFGAQVSF